MACITLAGTVAPAQAKRIIRKPIIKYATADWRIIYDTERDKRVTTNYVKLLLDCLEDCITPNSEFKAVLEFRSLANEYLSNLRGLTPMGEATTTPPSVKVLELVPHLGERRLISRAQAGQLRTIFSKGVTVSNDKGNHASFAGDQMADFREFIEDQLDILFSQTVAPDMYLVLYNELQQRTLPLMRMKILIILERALSWQGGRPPRTVASYLKGLTATKFGSLPGARPLSAEPLDAIFDLTLVDSPNRAVAYWAVRVLLLFDDPRVWALTDEILNGKFKDTALRSALVVGVVHNPDASKASGVLTRLLDRLYRESTKSSDPLARGKWLAEIFDTVSALRKLATPETIGETNAAVFEEMYKKYFKASRVEIGKLYDAVRRMISLFEKRKPSIKRS